MGGSLYQASIPVLVVFQEASHETGFSVGGVYDAIESPQVLKTRRPGHMVEQDPKVVAFSLTWVRRVHATHCACTGWTRFPAAPPLAGFYLPGVELGNLSVFMSAGERIVLTKLVPGNQFCPFRAVHNLLCGCTSPVEGASMV